MNSRAINWQACALTLTLAVTACMKAEPIDWVNLYIGTGSGPIDYGGTMPFVTPPFGMTNWTAQTRQNKVSGVSYKYEDTTISGFIGHISRRSGWATMGMSR